MIYIHGGGDLFSSATLRLHLASFSRYPSLLIVFFLPKPNHVHSARSSPISPLVFQLSLTSLLG
ncbi:unnamed protein product [Arabidopsis lyrata]|uniref:Predicted protein n=1 Tax=Arabidopsis lyrata subsp. lyrata TaxID=81972 RepID=D7LPV2_ARALL|nr:predicted protein [Arabidopsis lyrata subsp. lyrata]CAH8267063.1 unnamed protein product [Arabidopsis lyrata]